jgi:hypothetical protein
MGKTEKWGYVWFCPWSLGRSPMLTVSPVAATSPDIELLIGNRFSNGAFRSEKPVGRDTKHHLPPLPITAAKKNHHF